MADHTSRVRVEVDADATGASSKLGGFIGIAGKAALGIGALGIGAAVGANKLYAYADAQDDANASVAQGLETMGLFGAATADITDRVLRHATALSKSTAVDVTSIKTTQAKLLTFKELAKTADYAGGSFDRATAAAIDMAAKGFGTAESNAVALGKAMDNPVKGITALTKSGVTFTEAEKTKIAAMVESGNILGAQGIILDQIEKQVGGTAAATAGGFELMKNRASLFAQEIAAKALPYMDQFGNFMINKGVPALQKLGAAIAEKALPVLRQLGEFISTRVVPVLGQLADFVINRVVPAYSKVLAGAIEGARGFFKNLSKSVDDNRGELNDLGEAAKKAAGFFVDKVVPVLGDIYKNVLPVLGSALGTAIDKVAAFASAFQTVYDKVEAAISAIGRLIEKAKNIPGGGLLGGLGRVAAGGAGAGLPQVPLGLLNPRTAGSSAAPISITINVPGGYIGNDQDLAARLAPAIARAMSRRDVSLYGQVA